MADETSSDLCFGGKSSLSFPWGWHQTDITIKVQSLKSDSEAHATDIRLKFSAPNYLKSRELRGKHFSLMCVSFEISYHEKKISHEMAKMGSFQVKNKNKKCCYVESNKIVIYGNREGSTSERSSQDLISHSCSCFYVVWVRLWLCLLTVISHSCKYNKIKINLILIGQINR